MRCCVRTNGLRKRRNPNHGLPTDGAKNTYRESLLFTCIRAGGAYDHDTATPLPRDQSSQAAVMERRTKTSSPAIPGEAASLSERRASKASFSLRRRASDSMLMITKSPERDPLIPK